MSKPTNGFDKRPQDINLDGRPEETEERKEAKRLEKEAREELKAEFIKDMEKGLDVSATALKKEAEKGNIPACKEINDRALGKSKEHVDITSDGKPLGVVMLPSKQDGE